LQQSSDAEIVKGFRRYLQEAIARRVIAEHYQFLGDLSANLPQLSSLGEYAKKTFVAVNHTNLMGDGRCKSCTEQLLLSITIVRH